MQFYEEVPPPRRILLDRALPEAALVAEALSERAERKVEISVPQRGTKIGLVEHATQNAREALGRRMAETSSQKILLEGVADRFGLAKAPRRIEVYDNSHIMGTSAVGAMIVAGAQGLAKNQYRKFNIKSDDLTPGDDYAMMREVLQRRFKRLMTPPAEGGAAKPKADDDSFPHWPDLVIIDGGRGQLNAVREIFEGLGLTEVALLPSGPWHAAHTREAIPWPLDASGCGAAPCATATRGKHSTAAASACVGRAGTRFISFPFLGRTRPKS